MMAATRVAMRKRLAGQLVMDSEYDRTDHANVCQCHLKTHARRTSPAMMNPSLPAIRMLASTPKIQRPRGRFSMKNRVGRLKAEDQQIGSLDAVHP
jgi:hypothetical protein